MLYVCGVCMCAPPLSLPHNERSTIKLLWRRNCWVVAQLTWCLIWVNTNSSDTIAVRWRSKAETRHSYPPGKEFLFELKAVLWSCFTNYFFLITHTDWKCYKCSCCCDLDNIGIANLHYRWFAIFLNRFLYYFEWSRKKYFCFMTYFFT